MTAPGGELGVVRDYEHLLEICRARKDELNTTFAAIDDFAGLCAGYSAKLLSPRPARTIGMVSLPALLGALGLKLVVVEDTEAMARIRRRLVERHIAKPEIPHWRNRLHPPAL